MANMDGTGRQVRIPSSKSQKNINAMCKFHVTKLPNKWQNKLGGPCLIQILLLSVSINDPSPILYQILVDFGIGEPNSIAVDFFNYEVCWTDAGRSEWNVKPKIGKN